MKTSTWRRSWRGMCVGVVASAGLAVSLPAWASGKPTLHKSSQHYKEVPSSAAIGRSGSATLSVRALIGHDKITVMELTTGSLDSTAPAPGSLGKVQLKTFDCSDHVRSTRNFNDLSGATAQLKFTDMARGEPFQVQANERGIDGARTDVVTVRGTVKLRPDLTVQRVTLPSTAAVNTPVNVSAEITERNGDTAATADCVLSVDETEVDRAKGIWVNAGRTVSCAFVHTFNTSGNHTVTVSVAKVSPADDDGTNNSASAAISIIEPSHFKYAASVRSYDYQSSSSSSSTYAYDNGSSTSGSDFSYTSQSNGTTQQVAFSGQLDTAVAFPLSVNMSEASDGAQALAVNFANITADWTSESNGSTQACASRYDDASYAYLFVCSTSSQTAPQTSVNYSRYAGDVTYFSSQFSNNWWRDDSTGDTSDCPWTYNSDYTASQGVKVPVGKTFAITAKVTSGDASFSAKADIQPVPYQLSDGAPYSCDDYSTGSSIDKTCSQWSNTQTGVAGQTTGG